MSNNKGFLAKKLQQNWMTRFPDSRTTGLKEQVDDSLTNLNWLPNFDCRNALPSNQNGHAGVAGGGQMSMIHQHSLCPAASAAAVSAIGCGGGGSGGNNAYGPFLPLAFPQNMSIASLPHPTPPDSPVPPSMGNLGRSISCDATFTNPPLIGTQILTEKERAFYRTNSSVKPPYAYADLICLAMKDLRKSKITLSDIYNWIQDNFIFYKMADPSWQNSVRHNLSLNKYFQKVPRRKDEPGKGGFWRINPEYLGDTIENNAIASNAKRRRNLPPLSPSTALSSKRARVGFGQHQDAGLMPHPGHHHHAHHHQQQQLHHHHHQQQQPVQGYGHLQHLQQPLGQQQCHQPAMSRSHSLTEESLNLYPGALPRLSAFSDPYMAAGEAGEASSLDSMLPQDEGVRQYTQAVGRSSQAPLVGHPTRPSPIFSMAGSHATSAPLHASTTGGAASAFAPIQLPDPGTGASPRRVSSGGSTSSGATPPLPIGDEFLEGFLAAELDGDDLPPIDLQEGDEVETGTGDALDLTIHGVSLKPPEWWNSSLSSEKSILGPTLQSSLSCSLGRGTRILVDGRCGATPSPLTLEENQLDLDQLDQLLGLN